MSFVQIVESRTSRADEILELMQQWDEATTDKRTARRVVVCRDRSDPNRYFTIVFFDSYESAMENSQLPETQQFAEQLRSKFDGEPTFYDLDVIADRE